MRVSDCGDGDGGDNDDGGGDDCGGDDDDRRYSGDGDVMRMGVMMVVLMMMMMVMIMIMVVIRSMQVTLARCTRFSCGSPCHGGSAVHTPGSCFSQGLSPGTRQQDFGFEEYLQDHCVGGGSTGPIRVKGSSSDVTWGPHSHVDDAM